MLKDTKSLGNNKAPACESRGFVLKKEGVLFDTPSLSFALIHRQLFIPQLLVDRLDIVENLFPSIFSFRRR